MTSGGFVFSSLLLLLVPVLVHTRDTEIGCLVLGQCHDNYNVGISEQLTAQGCLDYCNATLECNYFTHYSSDNVCFALNTCGTFVEDCTDCVSG